MRGNCDDMDSYGYSDKSEVKRRSEVAICSEELMIVLAPMLSAFVNGSDNQDVPTHLYPIITTHTVITILNTKNQMERRMETGA